MPFADDAPAMVFEAIFTHVKLFDSTHWFNIAPDEPL